MVRPHLFSGGHVLIDGNVLSRDNTVAQIPGGVVKRSGLAGGVAKTGGWAGDGAETMGGPLCDSD